MSADDIKELDQMTLGMLLGNGEKQWGECRKEASENGLDWDMVEFHASVEYESQQRLGAGKWN